MIFGVNTMRQPLGLSCLVHGYAWVEMVRGCDYWAENGEKGSSVGGLVLLLSLSVIQIWFSLEWGCDVGDLKCEMVWISRDMEGMIICCRFHDSDWISIISDAGRHYFRVRTAITLSPMPLNEL